MICSFVIIERACMVNSFNASACQVSRRNISGWVGGWHRKVTVSASPHMQTQQGDQPLCISKRSTNLTINSVNSPSIRPLPALQCDGYKQRHHSFCGLKSKGPPRHCYFFHFSTANYSIVSRVFEVQLTPVITTIIS